MSEDEGRRLEATVSQVWGALLPQAESPGQALRPPDHPPTSILHVRGLHLQRDGSAYRGALHAFTFSQSGVRPEDGR